MEREIKARSVLSGIEEVVPILDAGDNWIEMPYMTCDLNWRDTGYNLYPLEYFDRIYDFIDGIYRQGCCMVDWHRDSFFFQGGKLHACDFEYFYRHSAPEKYALSPDLTGAGQEHKTQNGAVCSFANTWQKILGVTLEDYLSLSQNKLRKKRKKFLLQKRYPAQITGQLVKRPLTVVKNNARFRWRFEHGKHILEKRF